MYILYSINIGMYIKLIRHKHKIKKLERSIFNQNLNIKENNTTLSVLELGTTQIESNFHLKKNSVCCVK